MTPFADLDARIDALAGGIAEPTAAAAELLAVGERVLENWLTAHGKAPTDDKKEGFRLLALHRQAAQGDPGFNACRETGRELVYHYNLITLGPAHDNVARRVVMMSMIARHLLLFVSGKLQEAELGEFCCASKPLRAAGG